MKRFRFPSHRGATKIADGTTFRPDYEQTYPKTLGAAVSAVSRLAAILSRAGGRLWMRRCMLLRLPRRRVLYGSTVYYEICARMRRTPAEDDCSFLIWKRPISEVLFTCGP